MDQSMDQIMTDVPVEGSPSKDAVSKLETGNAVKETLLSPTARRLSPAFKLKKSPSSKALVKALRAVRGKTSRSLGDFSTFSSAENTIKHGESPISATFNSQLALVPSTRTLTIAELSDTINFRFAFEGKVLSKYGTYKITKGNYGRHMRVDLIDRDSRHTVTFVVTEVYLSEFVEGFSVGEFIRVEGVCVKRKISKDGGTCPWSLYADATTVVVKGEPFECTLQLYPEHRIRDLLNAESLAPDLVTTIAFTVVKIENSTKSDGTPSYRLTVADGPAHADRASLLFVPSRRADYHFMVNEVKSAGSYCCVAHNINIFKQLSNTLSIVDATILCSLPPSLEATFAQHLSKQVSNLGFGKKVFGTLEIVNVNSLDVDYVCESCKGTNVSRQATNPFCYTCGQLSKILKSPSLQAKIIGRDGEGVGVLLQGVLVDVVLGLARPFLHLYEHNLVELKSSLINLKKVGTFSIDKQGLVIEYKPA